MPLIRRGTTRTDTGDDMVTSPLTGATVTIRDDVKTCRDASDTITQTAPYHAT